MNGNDRVKHESKIKELVVALDASRDEMHAALFGTKGKIEDQEMLFS